MPNVPLQQQPYFVPLYSGLTSEIVDKMVTVGGGVLQLDNMVCSNTGELSKRDGSTDLVIPTTATLPSGGSLPALYELTTYRSELVRLSLPGPTPLWSYLTRESSWLQPNAATSSISSMFRGPIVTSLTNLVDNVTIGTTLSTSTNSSIQCQDIAVGASVALVAYEQFSLTLGANVGITEEIIDIATKKAIYVNTVANAQRPKCITIGVFLCVAYVSLTTLNLTIDVYDTTALGSGTPTTYTLTSGSLLSASSLLEVTAKNPTTATIAYTVASGSIVNAVDFAPGAPSATLYALHTNAGATFPATSAMAWVQDFGGSGQLALVTGDSTNGLVAHWGFGAISGSVSTASADYVLDSTHVAKRTAISNFSGIWNIAAYTTSNSSTGDFVVLYDVGELGNSALFGVYRASRSGSTITAGQTYWFGAGLASKFWQTGDGATYILTSFSNTANLIDPQNTFFVCADGIGQPVPLATVAPQAAGGITQRASSLVSVPVDPITGNKLTAIASLADLQFVSGLPVQLFGVELLEIQSLGSQDTTLSEPIEAFGSLLVPGGTLMAYDGKTYAEAMFANRPEPPQLIPANTPQPGTIVITHSVTDQVIGAPIQPLIGTKYDVVMGAPVTLIHASTDSVIVSGGTATYTFNLPIAFTSLDFRSLQETLIGGSITVASSGITGNNGTFVIVNIVTGPTTIQFHVSSSTQSSGALGPSTTASAVSPNPGRIFLSAPGISVITDDVTFKNQNLVITGNPSVNFNLGTFVLDATHPVGSATLNGFPYSFFYPPALASTAIFEEYYTFPPSLSLQLADPSLTNQWTFTNATFDTTYIGGVLNIANAKNPTNNGQFRILAIISPTIIQTSPPLNGGAGQIIRNEFLGATSTVTATVTPSANVGVGTHSYVALYSCLDANGRKWRSPPSLPATVTTTPLFPGVTAVAQCLNFTGRSCMIEFYRTPTNGDGQQYNKVASVTNNAQASTAQFNDNLTDLQIAEQEELFTDGGILPGTPLPGISFQAIFQNRIWTVSPENPQSLFYSNPDDSGSSGGGDGLLFDTTNLSLDIIDVHGPITAIKPMDTCLVVFKKDAIYFVIGNGPDGTGAAGSYQSTLIASGIGCSNPRSIVLQVGSGTQSDGVWFQSNSKRSGWFTVLRGGTIENTGAGIRKYSNEQVISALVYPALSQIRWYTVSGRTLIWDWVSKLWSTNTNQGCLSAVVYQDVPTYAISSHSGYILQEQTGLYQEGTISSTYVPISTALASPWLSLANLKGWERIYRIQGVGSTAGAHTLTIKAYGDYDDTNLLGTYTKSFNGTSTDWSWELRPSVQKLDSLKLVITATDPIGATAGTAGFKITGVTLIVGVKKGIKKLSDATRMVES